VLIEGVKNVDASKEMRFIGDCGLKPTKNIYGVITKKIE
jgi:hypothetical protein